MRNLYLLFAWLSLSAVAISQNLVAYYPFNGNANDQSGNAINPTLIGSGVTLTTDRFGNTNKAYNFDGAIGSYIRMNADLLPTTNRTISLWFNVPDVTNRPGLFSYGGNGSCGTTLFMGINLLGNGQYYVQGHCGNNAAGYSYITAPVSNWYHWVLIINGSAQKIYINGQLKSTDNTFGGSTAVAGKDFSLGVITSISGAAPYTDMNVGYLNGKLDDIRIYDAAMNDAQVLELYQNESTGLVAYYPFNGNANDESGNGNNGTVNGATLTTDRFGNSNKAYNFNGANNFISVADNPELFSDELTLSWWYKVPEYSGTRVVIGWVNGGNRYQQFFSGNSFAYFNGYYNSCCFFNPTYNNMTAVNQWQHVTVTYKKTNTNQSVTRLYINGELKQTDNHAAAITYQPGATFFIGKTHDGGYFNGELDDIRVYSRLLSPNEILQLADIPIMPDLLAYLPMNGNANDVSGNNHNGTVVNAALTIDKYENTNSAYQFNGNGTSSSITLANSTSLDFYENFSGRPFSLAAWVKLGPNTGDVKQIVGKHNCGTPSGYLLITYNGQLGFWMSVSGTWFPLSTTETYSDGKWHHVVATYDVTYQRIYVDGVLKGSMLTAYNNPAYGAPLKIGEPSPPGGCGGTGVFNGSVDEVKIYGTALDASQVTALYKKSRGSGNAINFDGVDDHIVTNDYLVPATGDFTVELWVYNRNINGFREFISQGGGGTAFYMGTSQLTGYIRLGDTWGTTVELPLNKWVHLAVVKSGSNGVLYLDGIQVATSTSFSIGAGGTKTQIGKQYGPFLEYADAFLDEIRIWNAALSAAEVRDWMNRKITPNHPAFSNLVSYYNFDEKNVLLTYEPKGAKTGTLINGPQYVTSGAPIGDASVHNIANPSVPATLTLPTGENFSALQGAGTALGLYVYVVKDPPEIQTGILGLGSNDHYFGVKKVEMPSGTTASYTATYNYTGNPFVSTSTELTLQLFKRADNSATTWANSGATLNTTANTLIVTGQNTEYILGSSGFGLPVTLLSFEAKKINATTTQLNWKTAQEINNKGFEVQRSFDGSYFVNVGFVNGAGNSDVLKEYSTTDMPGKTGKVYYRLKQVDFDNNSKLSNIVSVLFDKAGIIKVYPNPAQQQVTVEGIDNYNRVQVLDATGKLVKEQLNNGQYQLNINLNGLKSGMYLLRLVNEKEMQTVKLIISN